MRDQHLWLASLLATASLAVTMPAQAQVPFTWDPAASNPPLPAPADKFTADTMIMQGWVRSVVQPDGTFVAERYQVIDGFSVGGHPVNPVGFGTAYGLYFETTDTGLSHPPAPQSFSSSDIKLMLDPGNQDGTVVFSSSDITFSNSGPTGEDDDIVLATGSMVTSSATFDPVAMVLKTHFLETFTPVPGQESVFVSPIPDAYLDFLGTNVGKLAVSPGSGGTTIVTVDGVPELATFAVPEPGSVLLLGSALLGLLHLRRRQPA